MLLLLADVDLPLNTNDVLDFLAKLHVFELDLLDGPVLILLQK